jgi:plastocyanin
VGVVAAVLWSGSVLAAEYEVGQNSKRFVTGGNKIEQIKIKAGDTIRFKNEDPFFHNIFSLSELQTFDLGSFPKGESKTVTFEKAGVVEAECAIHPEMHLTIEVQ